jgi:membrane protease YdiL (CAAX protease family)
MQTGSPATAATGATTGRRLPRAWIAVAVIAVFFWLDSFHLDLFRRIAGDWTGYPRMLALAVLAYGPQLLVALAVAALVAGPRHAAAALGLRGRPFRALLLGIVLTAPMAIGLASQVPPALTAQTPIELLRMAVLPGFGEEVLYRGLLFGLLFRFAGWGFLPAALLAALVFGAAHLYQGGEPGEAAGIFALTALGSLWFAWLYVEWDDDLWVPIAFHVLMNAWWIVFPIADNAMGPAWTVGLRLAVVLLAVLVTLATAARRGGRKVRGRAWLWGGPAAAPTRAAATPTVRGNSARA